MDASNFSLDLIRKYFCVFAGVVLRLFLVGFERHSCAVEEIFEYRVGFGWKDFRRKYFCVFAGAVLRLFLVGCERHSYADEEIFEFRVGLGWKDFRRLLEAVGSL